MLQLRTALSMIVLLCIAIPMWTQDDACPALVQSALETVSTSCEDTGRNQVCYGNVFLSASTSDDAPDITFSSPGDLADVIYIDTLQLSVLNTPDEWGIALMKIQANLPDTIPGQNVTMLLFGEVYIANQATALPDPLSGKITASANLRSGPSTDYRIVGAGTLDEEVTVDARNEAGDWFRIFRSESDELAWVFGSLIEIDGDTRQLSVVEVDDPVATGQFGPMQAFYFRSGVGELSCDEAPPDGILIQTPEGAGNINLNINEVRIELGSTAFLTAVPDDYLTITLLDGQGTVSSAGRTVAIPAGLRARIPLDSDGLADGPPELVTYEGNEVVALPIEVLPEPFDLPEPANIPTPTPNPVLGFAGTWNIGATSPASCSNGLSLLGAGTAHTSTFASTGSGLTINGSALTQLNDTTYRISLTNANGTIITQTYAFNGTNSGTYTLTFDVNGAPNYGCNEVVSSSAPMTR